MSLQQPLKRALLLATLPGISACSDPQIETLEAKGERIDVHYAADFELCEGTVPTFDRGIVFVAEQLGLDPDTFEHMTFTWLTPEELDQASYFFFDGQAGWAWGSKSYGQHPLIFHELVHMIAHQEQYNSITFFTEGLAVAFEEGDTRVSESSEVVDPRPYLGVRYDEIDYRVAGAFVTYLLSRFGPEPFWQLNSDLHFFSNENKFRRRFASVYGLDLDEVVESYMTDETCPEGAVAIPQPPSCAGEEIPWQNANQWIYSRIIDCADDDVAGGEGTDDITEIAVTLNIDESGPYSISLASDYDVTGVLHRCGSCPWLHPDTIIDETNTGMNATEGLYSLVLRGRATDATSLVVEIRPSPTNDPD
ncbi:MAG TPA: hypothetical protein ENJ18_13585 [Nannocystis exedens]|nr:hypothetical protein [Nannocystis exedens]